MKLSTLLSIIAATVLVVFIVIKIVTHKPAPRKEVKIDVEKLGKQVGDLKRKFMKGYNDTTTVKIDSLKDTIQ